MAELIGREMLEALANAGGLVPFAGPVLLGLVLLIRTPMGAAMARARD